MSEKRFSSVSDLVSDLSDDTSTKEEFDEQLQSRQIVKALVTKRVSRGILQQEIADEIGCKQSTISKLENGLDGDLRLRDLDAYARVLGEEAQILFSNRNEGLADLVKFHAFRMRDALLSLVRLAHKDDKIVQGVARLHAQAFFNIMSFLKETSSQLPPCPDNGQPYVRIVACETKVAFDNNEDEAAPLGLDLDTVPFETAP